MEGPALQVVVYFSRGAGKIDADLIISAKRTTLAQHDQA
jgi:hypothetical protein